MILLQLSSDDIKIIFYSIAVFTTIGLWLTAMILYARARLIGSTICRVYINDEANMTKETMIGDTLLNTLTSNGIPIPSPCGGKATCKQCRVQVKEGGGTPLETEISAFSRKQIAEGWRLSCQCKVKQDIKIHVETHLLGVKQWEGTVISNENVATYIKELIVQLPEDEIVHYRSGGYLQVHVPPFKTDTEYWRAINPFFA